MGTNVLVIGSGGREHALAWKLAQSLRIGNLYVAPGNGGTEQIVKNVAIDPEDIVGLLDFAKKEKIDLTVVGSENSLASGVVELFQGAGLRIFGPTLNAAQIETSKLFAKEMMVSLDVPTPSFKIFSSCDKALYYVRGKSTPISMPIVVKADGLSSGKGVYICKTVAEAQNAIADTMVNRIYGHAGQIIIIENFLEGPEISIHAFCDGKNFVLFPPAQDHKPVFDNNIGANTGGMGAIAPVPWGSPDIMKGISDKIVQPILRELHRVRMPFVGCLYPGLKMAIDNPGVLEFNARPGDPETQCYMRLLKTDLLDLLEACVDGKVAECKVEWHPGFAVCVVLASGGYPGDYKKGFSISGIKDAESISGVTVFHAGTIMSGELLKTSGGRVLGVTATGSTLRDALDNAYFAIGYIKFDNMHYRRDIGAKSFNR